MKEDLAHCKKRIDQIPIVMQYSKIDLTYKGIALLPTGTLEKDLNRVFQAPYFEVSARLGNNVISTLKKIVLMPVASKKKYLKNDEFKKKIASIDQRSQDIKQLLTLVTSFGYLYGSFLIKFSNSLFKGLQTQLKGLQVMSETHAAYSGC